MRLSTPPTNARPRTKSRSIRPTPDSPWNGLPEDFEDIFLTPVELGILLLKENFAQPILDSLNEEWSPTREEIAKSTERFARSMGEIFDEATRITERLITQPPFTDVANFLSKFGELDLLRNIGSVKFAGAVTDGQGGNQSR